MSVVNQPVLKVRDLKVHYPMRKSLFEWGPPPSLKAVQGVSLDLAPGEVLGLVGESGCGKSSFGKALMRLQEPTAGSIEILGQDFLQMRGKQLRLFRKNIQMVFQDPYASLNPRLTVSETLGEPLKAHFRLSSQDIQSRIKKLLDQVGLSSSVVRKYPHEFSGGQRQRIAIARALILEPKIIVADEPVSSLDVSVQAQILNLLKEVQRNLGLSMIFISHNLAVVKYISDRISVMYLGKIVETADRKSIYETPLHPYTQALVSAVPIADPKAERERKRIVLSGELPSPVNPPEGCAFHTRCPWVQPRCVLERPELLSFLGQNRGVACFEAGKNQSS